MVEVIPCDLGDWVRKLMQFLHCSVKYLQMETGVAMQDSRWP